MRSGWKAGWHTSSSYILPAMYRHLLIIYIYTYYHNTLQWWNNIHELSIYTSWLLLSCNMLQVPHPHPQCSIEYLPNPGKCLYNCVYTYIHTVIYKYVPGLYIFHKTNYIDVNIICVYIYIINVPFGNASTSTYLFSVNVSAVPGCGAARGSASIRWGSSRRPFLGHFGPLGMGKQPISVWKSMDNLWKSMKIYG